MAEGRRHRSRPFPAVLLEFGRDGVSTHTRERIAVAKGRGGETAPPIVRTPGVEPLRKILLAATLRHADLSREIAEHEAVLAEVRAKLRVAQLFVVRLFMADRIRGLAKQGEAEIASLARIRAEREAGRVELYFGVDTATTISYAALTRAFEDLAGYGRVWDTSVLTEDGQVGRVPVVFSVGASDIVICREDVLLAPFGRGDALQIFPGFVLLREAADAIVLEHHEIELEVTPGRFVEDEALPGDAMVVGEAWPDDEPDPDAKEPQAPLPVVEYGELALKVPAGQLAAYVFSNYTKARVFVEAYEQYKRALAAVVEADEPAEIPTPTEPPFIDPPLDVRSRTWLAADWMAIILAVVLLSLPFALRRPAPPPAPPPAPAPAVAKTPAAEPDGSAARPRPKPKRVVRKAAAPPAKPGEPCGLIRQPNSVLKLVPCPPAPGPQP